jgi:multisubunit Na+/H+ antiporter MnhG subunit
MTQEETTSQEGNATLTHNTDEIVVIITIVTGCLLALAIVVASMIFNVEFEIDELLALLAIFISSPLSYIFGKTQA